MRRAPSHGRVAVGAVARPHLRMLLDRLLDRLSDRLLAVAGGAARAVVVGPGRGAVVDVAVGAAGHDVGHRRALVLPELGLAAGQLGLAGVEAFVARGQLALAAAQVLVASAGLLET